MPASLSHEQARQHEVSGDSPGPRHFRKDRGTSYLKGFENPSGKGKRHLLLPVVDGMKGNHLTYRLTASPYTSKNSVTSIYHIKVTYHFRQNAFKVSPLALHPIQMCSARDL